MTTGRPGLSPSLAAMLTSPGWSDVVVLGGGGDPRLTGSVVALEVSVHPEPLDGQVLVVLLAGDHTDWRIECVEPAERLLLVVRDGPYRGQ